MSGLKPRRLLVRVAPLAGEERGSVRGLRRRHRDAPARIVAQGLRGQRVARAPHAGHGDPFRGRNARQRARSRSRGDPTIHRHHRAQRRAPAGLGRGLARPVAHRVARAAARARWRSMHVRIYEHVVSLFRERADKKRIRLVTDVPDEVAAGARGPPRARAHPHESRGQRGQVLPERRGNSPRRARARRRRAALRQRRRPGNRSTPPAATVRALLPRRCRPLARARAEPGWAFRSSNIWSSRCAVPSASKARPAPEPRSTWRSAKPKR